MKFVEQMAQRKTSILKCQFIISMPTLSLLSLNRLIISHYQSRQFAALRIQRRFLDFEITNSTPARFKYIALLSSRHYWIYLMAMLRLVSLHLLFILFFTEPYHVMSLMTDVKYIIINNTYL